MIWQKIKNKGTFISIERINKFREVVSKASFIVGNPATYNEHCVVKISLIRLVVFIKHLISILWKTSIQYRVTYKDSDFHGNMKTLDYIDLKDKFVSCNAYCLLYYADLATYSSSLKKP